MRLWLNGHEWVKRGLLREGIIFEELDNGFRSVAEPARLQTLSDQLSADDIQGFFDRWLERLPNPYTTDERKFYSYRLSILQMEFSLTQVFTQPRYGRQFFEELIRENLDMGRPDRVQLAFNRRVTRRTPGRFRTRVITTGVDPSVYVDYKSSKIKQYYKHGRALHTELTINDTYDVGLGKALKNFDALREIGRNVNRRLIEAQCLNSNPQVESSTFADVVLPGMVEGRRTPSLRYGDPRVMAVLTGLCGFFPVVAGFRNRDLWNRVNPLVGEGYTQRQMTHDLKRLRLNGLVERPKGRHSYHVTPTGRRVASLFCKSYSKILKHAPYDEQDFSDPAGSLIGRAWKALDRAIAVTISKYGLTA
ncbi:hypothetical protein IV102_25730, partial [bacterium]|nr:hypothetical protein [bacterium]